MTAYAQYSAKALLRYPEGQYHSIANQTDNDGDVIQLADGRIGVVAGLGGGVDGVSIGDPVVIYDLGIFEFQCNNATAFTQGQLVYWDPINLQIVASYSAANATFLAGFVTKAVASGATSVLVDINAGFSYNNVLYLNSVIASTAEVGNTVTVTCSALHGLVVGQTVWISGVSVAGYNGAFVVATAGTTTFTYTNSVASLGAGTGGLASWVSTAPGQTIAAAGTTAATGTPILALVNFVTGATGTNCVTLPPPSLNQALNPIVIVNTNASNALLVFPHGSEKIDAGSAGASKSMALSTTAIYRCDGANWWEETAT